jgi:hypothetical protein
MEKNLKNNTKIGLSLLIALIFVLPTASAVVTDTVEREEAGDTNNLLTSQEPRAIKLTDGPISQNGPMVFATDMYAENPDEEIIRIEPDITLPVEDFYIFHEGIYAEPGQEEREVEVQAGMSLYKVERGLEVVLYETSFEDNFDIYNNWIQIDGDCSEVGGYFDTFSWSDARASDGEHSMKSTMYDVYKGNQNDYLELQDCFNFSGQHSFNVSFDVWVEGQDEDTWMPPNIFYDYLSFEIDDGAGYWNPFWFVTRDGLDWDWFFFSDTTLQLYWQRFNWNITWFAKDLGGGWWHVWYEMPVSWLIDETCVKFRFDWHTDPQFQYEGAYVDNFKVVSIESDKEKIFQTHLQDCTPVPVCDETAKVEFPLAWDDVEPGDYMIQYWVEVEDCDPYWDSEHPKPGRIVYFSIGDNLDCVITDILVEDSFTHTVVPDGGRMTTYSDAHIKWTYHQGGNVPGENIPIKLSVKKKSWDPIVEKDMDSLMGWQTYGDIFVDDDAYSGSGAIRWADEDTQRYKNYDFSYIYGPKIDFADAEEVLLDFYWKGLTEDPTWFGDMGTPCLHDPDSLSLLSWGPYIGGNQPDYIGPENPMGRYATYDLTAAFEYWQDVRGYFRDGDGNKVTTAELGFFFQSNADGINYNVDAYERGEYRSGIWIDDVTVRTKVLGEEVYTDTIIIPGPVEPCETVTGQFEWEDVPFSHYKICVEALCEGDVNESNNKKCQQVLVTVDLERMWKPEGEDLTECDCGWGRCGSDTDWYLSTNPDSETYPAAAKIVAKLCPDGDPCIQVGDATDLDLTFDTWYDLEGGWDWVELQITDGCPDPTVETDWTMIDWWSGFSGGWYNEGPYDLSAYITGSEFQLRFVLYSDYYTEYRGMLIDDLQIGDLFGPDDMNTMDNWCMSCLTYGDYWEYDDVADEWCIDPIPVLPVDDALVWTTEIADAYEAYLTVTADWDLENCLVDWGWLQIFAEYVALVEVSANGGDSWYVMDVFDGSGASSEVYDISFLAGNPLLVRVRVTLDGWAEPAWWGEPYGPEDALYAMPGGSYICVSEMAITGKKDTEAPVSTMTMSGTMKESGWYSTAVQVTITATDNNEVKEIHYVLDGVETVVAGDSASFTVSDSGAHDLSYWAVDGVGNVEAQHTVPTFRVDKGSAPNVAITAPTGGLYLFGRKIISLKNPIIIGPFTVEATASDAESGVYRVQFFLDGDLIGEDTEAPFSAYVATKHMGDGTLKATAEDFAQNIAEDTLDIKYFKLL